MRRVELREELEAYCSNLIRTITDVSTEIDFAANDPELQRALVTWKIVTFRNARGVLDTSDPRAGLIDMWAMSLQRRQWLETEDVKGILGVHQPIAVRGSETLIELLENLARDYFNEEAFEQVKSGVEGFVVDHPTVGFARPTLRVSIAVESGEKMPWFSRWTGLAGTTEQVQSIAGEIDQITWIMEWLPTLARWETEVLLLDLARNPVISDLSQNVNRTSLTLERFQQQSAELPTVIRKEITIALDEIDQKQSEIRQTMQQAQELIGESTKAVEKTQAIAETVERTLGERPELFAALDDTTESLTALARSLRPAVQEFRGMMEDMQAGEETPAAPAEDEMPMEEVLASVERTSKEFTASTQAIQASLVEVRSLLKSDDIDRRLGGAGATARDVVDAIFWRAIWFVLIAVAAVVAGVLGYGKLKRSSPAS
ncbi:MAG: hypothetical protein ACYSX0_07215 [Planctomycetota bacterium]|jgi:Sec-independent protein translocase protein TatA/ElaB/YqjD/DUF883 family membrane-anchored ribosome-binding protein